MYHRSLWFDEAALALNIVNRSYTELLNVLDHNQAAPTLFLWIEKLLIHLLGNNEYALRLFPFLCGMFSLWLFYLLAIRWTSGLATVIAIALFTSLKEILYYSAEVKQYSSDLTIGLLLFLLLTSVRQKILDLKQIISLSFLGGVAIWLSHPVVFIVAGVELTNLWGIRWQKIKQLFINRIFIYVFWLTNFVSLYVLTIQKTMSNENLVNSWGARYPDSILDIIWLLDAFGRFFHKPLGFIGIGDGIALVVFIIGIVILYKTNRLKLLLLNAPLLITLFAAYLHKYPFRDRLILFLSPYAVLIIATGISWLIKNLYWQYQKYRKKSNKKKYLVYLLPNLILTSAIVIYLTIVPLIRSSLIIVNPSLFNIEQIGFGVKQIKNLQQPTDLIYVFSTPQLQFTYYAQKYNIPSQNYIYAEANPLDDRENFQQKIAKIPNKERVWFVLSLSRVKEEELPQNKKLLLNYLDSVAQQVEVIHSQDFFIYLYDFNYQK
ncbi:MAG: hypothetical protein Tsb0014_19850 [Pleurocapsa sp.]